ncbi:MAG: D-aminoacylase [Alphaproteobacteria bacterium]|nr:MAG: D-aminoacylase [Alphaproteobacteria bacterium]
MKSSPVRVLSFIAIVSLWPSLLWGAEPAYDLLIRGGTVYDGTGAPGRIADIAVRGDRIVAVGDLAEATAQRVVDAHGLAVAPGFINTLSWATESLLADGRGQSDLRQGVTLEVFGEGWSMGPLTEAMRAERLRLQGDIRYDIPWTTLGDYLDHLEARGIAPNVASFVGATTVRIHILGYEDRPPDPVELGRMQALVAQAMEEGALGVGSSLIYAPAFYAGTDELVALATTAGAYGGTYISHIRSEGDRLLEAIDELIEIARRAHVPAQIYHLKAAGEANWPKLDQAIAKIEAARAAGLEISADMYSYTAGATGLNAAMPPWVQEGGHDAWVARLRDPAIRARVITEMRTPSADWENLLLAAGSAENVLLIGFKSAALKPLTGKTLAEVAKLRGKSPEETAIDLVIEDDSRVDTAYFLMSEANIEKKIRLPWVAFGSDEGAYTNAGVFLKSNAHPRAYGNFARVLGHYVRERRLIPLEEAIRRLTSFPAQAFRIRNRGCLAPGCFADIAIFAADRIADHASYDDPHRYATGMIHIFVNGTAVLRDGEPTGALPGRVVRGPGWRGKMTP